MNRISKLFNLKKTEKRSRENLLTAFTDNIDIGVKEAMEIPTLVGCCELIANTISKIPIKFYKENEKEIIEIKEDIRVKLLNDETGDLLDSFQMKKAFIKDYLLKGQSYIFINRIKNNVGSLHYIEEKKIAIIPNTDPIFKKAKIMINGAEYNDFDFIKITRNTVNGVQGTGIIKENSKLLSVAYNSLKFEENLVKTGGNKKGFLKSQKRVSEDVMTLLKNAWRKLYSNNSENVIVLNDGLEFQEASNTSVEMQLNENKITNADEICKIFNTPPSVLKGVASEAEINFFIEFAIMPILIAIETALNKDLLLEKEKGSFYFAFDTKQLIKGDIYKKFQAYKLALDASIMQIDEVRYELDLQPLGFKYIKLGLQDVLLNPETGEIYTPNMNAKTNLNKTEIKNLEGGEKENED